jgi:homoserine dehydrogenase
VDGAFNAIFVEGQPIGQVMFFGPGAGSGPTASAVVSDVLNVAAAMQAMGDRATPVINPMLACSHSDFCPIASLDDLETRFYVRFLTSDRPGTIGHIGSCFGNRLVSLESLVQTEVNGDEAQVVVVTHAVREGDFRAALADIHASDAIRSVASVLRVI